MKLAWALVAKVLLGPAAPTRILKLVPLLEVANSFILAACRARTFAELSAAFEARGVWFTLVRSPAQALAYPQALATAAFRETEGAAGRRYVASPVQFR